MSVCIIPERDINNQKKENEKYMQGKNEKTSKIKRNKRGKKMRKIIKIKIKSKSKSKSKRKKMKTIKK